MTLVPLLVFGALAILLVVLFRRSRTASSHNGSSAYGGDAWTPMMWSDGNGDSNCDSSDTADCSGGDAGCDRGGGGCD